MKRKHAIKLIKKCDLEEIQNCLTDRDVIYWGDDLIKVSLKRGDKNISKYIIDLLSDHRRVNKSDYFIFFTTERIIIEIISVRDFELLEYAYDRFNDFRSTGDIIVEAVESNDIEILKYVFDKRSDVDEINTWIDDAMLQAKIRHNKQIIDFLIENGANEENVKNVELFRIASNIGDMKLMQAIYEKDQSVLDEPGRYTFSIIYNDRFESLKFIVKHSIDNNTLKDNTIYELIQTATDWGKMKMLKYLIKELDIKKIDDLSLTKAISKDYFNIVKFILENLEIGKIAINYALLTTARKGNIGIFKLLSKYADGLNFDNSICLSTAVENQQYDIIKYLFDNKK